VAVAPPGKVLARVGEDEISSTGLILSCGASARRPRAAAAYDESGVRVLGTAGSP
jgi:hypothetical protein